MSYLWKPSMIVESIGVKTLFATAPESVVTFAREQQQNGWRYFVVDQDKGRCYYAPRKVITIPLWVYNSTKLGQLIWYISHELAHTYAGFHNHHGPEFMNWLKKICPQEYQHWELTYKPRNAASAGITENLSNLKDFL